MASRTTFYLTRTARVVRLLIPGAHYLHTAPTIYFEIRRGDDKEQNDEDKTIHGKQLYKVAEIELSPRRWIKNLIIIYFIFDHWFGEQKLHNFLVNNLQQQTKSE